MSTAPNIPASLVSVISVVHAPLEDVWRALTDTEHGLRPTPNSRREGLWTEGGTVTWSGERDRKPFRETAKVLQLRMPDLLKYSRHTEGDPAPHLVTIELKEVAGITHVRVQENRRGDGRQRAFIEEEWTRMLDGLKKTLGEAPTPEPEVQRT